MSSLTPLQVEIAFTVSQRSPSKVKLHVYGAHAYTITNRCRCDPLYILKTTCLPHQTGERGGSVVECRTPEREVRGSRPTAAVLCPWARHFTPRKYWLITQEAMAPSRHDWKIVDWDVKPQHNQPTNQPHQTVYFHCVELSGLLNFLIYPGGGSQIHVLR